MAKGQENLRVPTSEEAREIGRKGGIASGKARKAKKSFAEAARWALEMESRLEIGGESQQISQYQAIVLNLLEVARDKENKQWIQAAQMLFGLENGAVNIEKTKAEIERIKAETERMKGGTEQHNGMLEELIKGLQDGIHTETESTNADVASGQTETN